MKTDKLYQIFNELNKSGDCLRKLKIASSSSSKKRVPMEKEMSYGSDYRYIPATSRESGEGEEVLDDLFCQTIQIVNITFVGKPEDGSFVLVDTGMPKSANEIISITEDRFGKNSRPDTIILTHGHFDHVGASVDLVKHWNTPVYAHKLELPFLTGKKSYPEPDPTVEGGMVAKISAFFPDEPVDLTDHVEKLPSDGTVPGLPDFRWIHTPGHSPGHVSLFREKDRALIAGDTFVTVKQDSLYDVITQKQEISGPPRYFTTDWEAAKNSVSKLEALQPNAAITGHGMPMEGELLSKSLQKLDQNFDDIAVPDHGKYVNDN